MAHVRWKQLGSAAALLLGLSACMSSPVVAPPVAPKSLPPTSPPVEASVAPGPSATAAASGASGLPPLSTVGALDAGGTFGESGLWGVRGSSLLTSTDSGGTWRRGTIPVSQPYVGLHGDFVLDPAHAWAVRLGPGSSGDAGGPVTHWAISRTTDGGRSWQTTEAPGNYPGTSPSIEFVDSRRGYLLAAAERLSLGTSTLLRTNDGGVTWTVAGHGSWLGSLLSVSDRSTIWAGGQEQAGGQFAQPVLAVSRDAGRSWSSVSLAGIAGTTEDDCSCYLPQPPLWLSSTIGYVVVASSDTQVYRTTDAGRTWSIAAVRPNIVPSGLAVFDPTNLLMPILDPTEVDISADAGTTWTPASAGGAWYATYAIWVAAIGRSRVVALAPVPGPNSLLALISSTDGGRTWQQVDVR